MDEVLLWKTIFGDVKLTPKCIKISTVGDLKVHSYLISSDFTLSVKSDLPVIVMIHVPGIGINIFHGTSSCIMSWCVVFLSVFSFANCSNCLLPMLAAVVAQWVRAFVPQAEGLLFESQPRQTLVVKTGSDSSTAKRSAMVWVSLVLQDDNYKQMPRVTVGGAS